MNDPAVMDELVAAALVGTGRKAPQWPSIEGELGQLLGTLASATPETRLLATVAAIGLYESAGRKPSPASAGAAPAVEETRKVCTRRAADLLVRIMAMPQSETKDRLLDQWLDHAEHTGRRAPFNLVPDLFRTRPRDARVRSVAGRRGEWLAQLNPAWQEQPAAFPDPNATWATGSKIERRLMMVQLRGRDPAAARELIMSSWKDEDAEQRAEQIGLLNQNLSEADEPFLESALDDRSKNVRATAAELLSRLPSSALVRRMIERATPLLVFTPPKQRLLRKDAPAGLEVKLPPDVFDPAWARDGVIEKPDGRLGKRQWWLIQFLAAIPPTHWSTAWGLSPRACMEVPAGEFADAVLDGWRRAALRHPDPAWVTALLTAAARDGRGILSPNLLGKLPAMEADALLTEVLRSSHVKSDDALAALRATTGTLSDACATALCQRIDANRGTREFNFLFGALQEAAIRLPETAREELHARWSDENAPYLKKRYDEFFAVLSIRREMQREFQS